MKRRHHTPELIVRKLRETGRMLGEGQPMVEVCKHLEVTEQTYGTDPSLVDRLTCPRESFLFWC